MIVLSDGRLSDWLSTENGLLIVVSHDSRQRPPHAPSRYLRAYCIARVVECSRRAVGRHVSAVAAGHGASAGCDSGARAADDLFLSRRLRLRSERLRTDLRSPWPQAG